MWEKEPGKGAFTSLTFSTASTVLCIPWKWMISIQCYRSEYQKEKKKSYMSFHYCSRFNVMVKRWEAWLKCQLVLSRFIAPHQIVESTHFNLMVLSQCNVRDCGCMCVLCTYMLVCLYKIDRYGRGCRWDKSQYQKWRCRTYWNKIVIAAVSASCFISTFLSGKRILHYLNQENIHKN